MLSYYKLANPSNRAFHKLWVFLIVTITALSASTLGMDKNVEETDAKPAVSIDPSLINTLRTIAGFIEGVNVVLNPPENIQTTLTTEIPSSTYHEALALISNRNDPSSLLVRASEFVGGDKIQFTLL